jgi:hypothetical protein
MVMVTCRHHIFLSVLGVKILQEPAARMVGVMSFVQLWWLMPVVTQV